MHLQFARCQPLFKSIERCAFTYHLVLDVFSEGWCLTLTLFRLGKRQIRGMVIGECIEVGTGRFVWPIRSGRFGLADSVWPFRSEPFWSRDFSVLVVSVSRHFG